MNPFERGVFLENDREMKVALSVAATIGETELVWILPSWVLAQLLQFQLQLKLQGLNSMILMFLR
ncbi:hypothetical protein SLEP1_g31060 [Rubroshorea leprosula]|uniref:Uncharacterized protein n=1 Tax=Rubroshorea leprosula TaxID=152421 RepID=A0AAV5KB18_9ROSI|nr:hypothetical protein SLEP1_g31060 [Rubroshorea leprosula]